MAFKYIYISSNILLIESKKLSKLLPLNSLKSKKTTGYCPKCSMFQIIYWNYKEYDLNCKNINFTILRKSVYKSIAFILLSNPAKFCNFLCSVGITVPFICTYTCTGQALRRGDIKIHHIFKNGSRNFINIVITNSYYDFIS